MNYREQAIEKTRAIKVSHCSEKVKQYQFEQLLIYHEGMSELLPELHAIWAEETTPAKTGKTRKGHTLGDCIETLLSDERWLGVIAKNNFSQQIVLRKAPPFGRDLREPLNDNDITAIMVWFEREKGAAIKKDAMWQAVLYAAEKNSFHSLQDYLSALKWDEKKRIDQWLESYCGVIPASEDQKTAIRAVARRWLVACVARAYEPGCKADNILILEGEQGAGKSSAFRALAGKEFFSDAPMNIGSKDSYLAMQGTWIYEWSELADFDRSDSSLAKLFLSQSTDTFRPPYGRSTITVPRSTVFCGTTNSDDYLKDTTGNRRYWTVRCSGEVNLAELVLNRDQLWAEAVYLYRAGEQWHLTPAEEQLLCQETREREQGDPWEEPIVAWLAERDGKEQLITMGGILSEALHLQVSAQHAGHTKKAKAILQRLGYTKHRIRIGGGNPWIYRKEN
jgi:putative DNA primase/helicase